MAAGGSLEPFWKLHPVHNEAKASDILDNYRIGTLATSDRLDPSKLTSGAFDQEPSRHPSIIPVSKQPFNGESSPSLIVDKFYTPQELMYVRNHHPTVIVDLEDYSFEFYAKEGDDETNITLSLELQ